MKKIILIGLILILLAAITVPAMAGGGPPNGHGNGVSTGPGNNGGNHGQERNQDKERDQTKDRERGRDRERDGSGEARGNGNSENTGMRTPFYLQGTVSAIDPQALTLSVTVFHGNARVKDYIGDVLPLQAAEDVLVYEVTPGGEGTESEGTPAKMAIELGEVAIGDSVAIHGNLVDGIYTARLITVFNQWSFTPETGEEP